MKLFILLFILCAQIFWLFTPVHYVDPELAVFNSYYIEEVNKFCTKDQYYFPTKTYITLDKLPDDQLGVCKLGLNRFTVIINIKYWYMFSDVNTQFATTIHELTHAYFKYGHSNDPHNFMYSSENGLSIKEVMGQLDEFLKKQCHSQ